MGDREKKHETNWWRVCRLLIECGRELLLHLFQDAVSPLSLRKFLIKEKSNIVQHRQKKKLNLSAKQFSLLYCEQKTTQQREDELELEFKKKKMDNWDITLISCLLNYFSENNTLTLTKEQRDSSKEIRDRRNGLYAHRGKRGFTMTDSEFEQQWQFVEKVLQDLQESMPEVDIRNKIKSIQKDTIVDGDQLKEINETFVNWMQSDKEKSDEQLASLTHTVNDGVTTVTEAVKESEATVTEAVKESEATVTEAVKENRTICLEGIKELATSMTKQILLQIQHQNQNHGVAMTDTIMTERHNGEEILSSQVSMDAEPDEGNNSVMETQTLPASSGNIAAGGERVLADRLLEMSVNEPVESRDESASNLQSNLLTEQRRHNEMPPGIGYIDCLILYAEVDRDDALKFKKHLINDIKIKKHGPVVALLYDDPNLRSLSESKIQYLQKVFELSTYKMLYVTKDFVEDKWEKFKFEVCIVQAITNEETQWSVVPFYPQTNEKFKVPYALEGLVGFTYKENDEHYKESLTNLIEARVKIRVKRNQSLFEEQQQRADEEIVDSHPQQDAFVQTSGQTPGASAGIQEANTIQGAEATDRTLDGMHNGEERLSSQVSMDAEPDETLLRKHRFYQHL